uniref:Putative conserved secreted protein n=1 Tax=Corethrella appendiculata TaxID=1370023 RepID=U5ESL0_9DIPT
MIVHWKILFSCVLITFNILTLIEARPDYEQRPNSLAGSAIQQQPDGVDVNYDEALNEIKLQNQELNYLANWIIVKALSQQQQQDSTSENSNKKLYTTTSERTFQIQNSRPIEILRSEIVETPEILPTPLPYIKKKMIKEREEKKNNNYMSLCHFKICNMGRKRNTRYTHFN